MKKAQKTSRATLRHVPPMTGRDGAIDFAAKTETSSTERVMLEMPPGELKSVDAWIRTQPSPRPSRPEAIRRLVEEALAGAQRRQKRSKQAASKARDVTQYEIRVEQEDAPPVAVHFNDQTVTPQVYPLLELLMGCAKPAAPRSR